MLTEPKQKRRQKERVTRASAKSEHLEDESINSQRFIRGEPYIVRDGSAALGEALAVVYQIVAYQIVAYQIVAYQIAIAHRTYKVRDRKGNARVR